MSGTRQLGIVLIVFGGLIMVGGAFAYSYQQTTTVILSQGYSYNGIQIVPPMSHDVTTTPYRDDTFPLILGSVALFVVGFALLVYRPQNSPPPQ
jgi:hypothetical protein